MLTYRVLQKKPPRRLDLLLFVHSINLSIQKFIGRNNSMILNADVHGFSSILNAAGQIQRFWIQHAKLNDFGCSSSTLTTLGAAAQNSKIHWSKQFDDSECRRSWIFVDFECSRSNSTILDPKTLSTAGLGLAVLSSPPPSGFVFWSPCCNETFAALKARQHFLRGSFQNGLP